MPFSAEIPWTPPISPPCGSRAAHGAAFSGFGNPGVAESHPLPVVDWPSADFCDQSKPEPCHHELAYSQLPGAVAGSISALRPAPIGGSLGRHLGDRSTACPLG